jgi:hypothetical protein
MNKPITETTDIALAKTWFAHHLRHELVSDVTDGDSAAPIPTRADPKLFTLTVKDSASDVFD